MIIQVSFMKRSTWFICMSIFFLIILTIISAYCSQIYSRYHEKQLAKLFASIESLPTTNLVDYKPFRSNILPKQLVKSIDEYLSNTNEYYLIIDCATGLGNRLQTIASGFLMAFLMNRRLLIHWPMTSLSSCSFNELFESTISLSSFLFTRYTKEYVLTRSDHLIFHGPFDQLLCHWNLTLFKRKYQFLFVSTDEYFLSVLFKNPAYSQTVFANVNEDSLFKALINYLFIPKKELNDQIDFHQKKMKHCHRGIHMRKEGLKQIKNNGEKVFLGKDFITQSIGKMFIILF